MGKLLNLTGQRFGKLIAIKIIGKNKIGKTLWLCKCDCGKDHKVITNELTSGKVRSCGCSHSEVAYSMGKNNKRYNKYNLLGEYGIGWTSNTNEEFYFDLEDYDKIKNYCWSVNSDGYIFASNEYLKLHKLITNTLEDDIVDHISGNKFDNRKINFRICLKQQNCFNSKLAKNNTSGVTGVYWDKNKNKWCAAIGVNYKKVNLGYYYSFDDAVKVRKDAEEEYFGEFSFDNSQEYSKQFDILNENVDDLS